MCRRQSSARGRRRIGVAIPGGELGLIDHAGLAIAAPDTEGELVYRGPNVMMGYADDRADLARGAEIDRLRTGDMAVREADGLYRITGRRRRMSKIAGVRIGHDALEASLARAGIAAAVVGDDHGVLAACTSPCQPDRVRARLAAASGLPMSRVRAVEVDALPRLATGKIDYEALRGRLDQGDDKPPSDLLAAFRQTFWPQPVASRDSFATLGGDLLRYLELSMLLDRHLGRTPRGWDRMGIADLAALRPTGGRRSTVASDIVIRVMAILMILVHHATDWPLPAGAATMMLLIGYGLGRFQLQTLLEGRFGRFFRPLLAVLAPYALILVGFALYWQAVPWASLLLVSNLGFGSPEQHTMLPYLYWFVEAYAQTLLIWAGLFLLRPVRRLAARDPFRLGLLLLAGALAARFIGTEYWPIGDRKLFAPWWLLPLAALGWCAATADTASKRMVLVAIATTVMSLLAYVGWQLARLVDPIWAADPGLGHVALSAAARDAGVARADDHYGGCLSLSYLPVPLFRSTTVRRSSRLAARGIGSGPGCPGWGRGRHRSPRRATRRDPPMPTHGCRYQPVPAGRHRSAVERDERRARPPARVGRWQWPLHTLRQRDELRLARHRVEPPLLPGALRLLDPLLAAGDEVPPEVARAIHGLAADQQEAGLASRLDGQAVAGAEDEHPAGLEGLAGDAHGAVEQVGGALLVMGVERELAPGARIASA